MKPILDTEILDRADQLILEVLAELQEENPEIDIRPEAYNACLVQATMIALTSGVIFEDYLESCKICFKVVSADLQQQNKEMN